MVKISLFFLHTRQVFIAVSKIKLCVFLLKMFLHSSAVVIKKMCLLLNYHCPSCATCPVETPMSLYHPSHLVLRSLLSITPIESIDIIMPIHLSLVSYLTLSSSLWLARLSAIVFGYWLVDTLTYLTTRYRSKYNLWCYLCDKSQCLYD